MAENERKSIGDLTIKVDVDISEALTGLKAVQREAKKAAQALRGLESEHDDVKIRDACIREIDRLASFFQREIPHEIHEGSAVDNAIRVIKELSERE